MTHEELLKSIEFGREPLVFEALWKVARLHKPTDLGMSNYSEHLWCSICHTEISDYDCANADYPCPTIQMIESVLPLVNLSPDMA